SFKNSIINIFKAGNSHSNASFRRLSELVKKDEGLRYNFTHVVENLKICYFRADTWHTEVETHKESFAYIYGALLAPYDDRQKGEEKKSLLSDDSALEAYQNMLILLRQFVEALGKSSEAKDFLRRYYKDLGLPIPQLLKGSSSVSAEWEVEGSPNRVKKIFLARVARLVWREPDYRENPDSEADKFEELVQKEEEDILNLKLEDEFKGMLHLIFKDGMKKVREAIKNNKSTYIQAIDDMVKFCDTNAANMPEEFKMKAALLEVSGYFENFKFRLSGFEPGLLLPEDISKEDKIIVAAKRLLSLKLYRQVMDMYPRIAAIISDVSAPRLHWAEKVAPEEGIIAFFPRTPVFDRLTSMPWALIDGNKGRLTVNPSPEKVSNLRASREVQPIMDSLPVWTKDGQEIKIMTDVASRYIQTNGIDDIKRLMDGMGITGIGLLPLEYLYSKDEYVRENCLPGVDNIRGLILEIANKTRGDVIVRTMDFQKEKAPAQLKDIGSFFGTDFYFKTEKGLNIVKNELMGIMLAYFYSDKKNIRILFPMVETCAAAEKLRELTEKMRVEAAGRLSQISRRSVSANELEVKYDFMIETKNGVKNRQYLSRVADGLAVGTSDLLRSFNNELYKAYAALKNIVDTLSSAKVIEGRPPREVIIAGDLANREEFISFYLYLWKLYPHIYLSPLLSQVQEVKNWLRNSSVQESPEMFDGLFLDEIPVPLAGCISDVKPQCWLPVMRAGLEGGVRLRRELPHAVGIAATHMLKYLGNSRKRFNLRRGGGAVAWFLRHFYNQLPDIKLRIVSAEERKGEPTLLIGED
ncbi:MAG TPA: hypothetical protein DEQ77_05955, partial [Candidatus Omnitrophica bacterium]|nr:hypothetical protein [Candidatus Omnitrophota bacterium]